MCGLSLKAAGREPDMMGMQRVLDSVAYRVGRGTFTGTVMSHPITVKVLISILRTQNGLTYLLVMILAFLSLASAYDSSLNDTYT
jgi:hypothetical protein